MTTIYLKSAYGKPSPGIIEAAARGEAVVVEQCDLTPELLLAHDGLITGQQLDQDAMLALRPALEAFLDNGGRWFFNGHVVRPMIEGLFQYRPITAPRRADFDLSSVNRHPLYDGIELKKLEANKGVAGFYGRGCNPLPVGAVAINGLGTAQVPVDWVWQRPSGGRFFSHAGNDLGSMGVEWGLAPELTARILAWTNGGPCFDPWPQNPKKPADILPLAEPETYGGLKSSTKAARRVVAPSSGTYYNVRSLEGSRYGDTFDVICTPEDLAGTLRPQDVLWVPCRTPVQRMIAQKQVIAHHLQAGGTVIALGESRSDLWLPAIDFTETPTNWWWWLDPDASLGVRATAPGHPLLKDMGDREVTWHLHGWFVPPTGAEVLARDGEGRAILYVDDVSTPGRMIISSLDPMFHHGSHFMPATTRFLDRFIPNIKAYINV
ncbi:hypothetical protein [Aminobacter sp. AP02]|uniref:hypothetical protein n=1 Tax=Aminobacter sp. AP02 TaxID=2135737 RepID=UPI000D6A8A7A|nr:hypothetical protein [Aminobacter sp. AP02]PWK73955.1 hypothetical protein C8K44_104127 [Aminobacter sp. AP02]